MEERGVEDSGLPQASELRATEHPAVWPGTQGNHCTTGALARGQAILSPEFCEQ